jgi:hypothetical protein
VRPIAQLVRRSGRALRALRGTVQQLITWGRMAPRRGEIIHVDPRQVRGYLGLDLARGLRSSTGFAGEAVIDGDWDLAVPLVDIVDTEVYRSCRLHWIEGVPWEDTALVQEYAGRVVAGAIARFPTHAALLERFHALDGIYEQVRADRRMSDSYRHLVRISIGRDGRLIMGPDGRHRLAIAVITDVDSMPARVGYVHPGALQAFQRLRSSGRRHASVIA